MRRIVTLAVVLFPAACGGGAQSTVEATPTPDALPNVVRYAPANLRYRARQHRHVEQEFNGQVTANDQVTTFVLSVDLVADEGGLEATLVLDSIDVTGSANATPQEIEAVRGTRFSGMLGPDGRFAEFTGGDTTQPYLRQVAREFEEFFPRIPADGVAPGRVWSDTTNTEVDASGITLEISSVNQHEALEWTEYAGERALKIHTVTSYTVSGSGQQGGQELELTGAGRRYVDQFLSADGRYLGSIVADTAEVDVLVVAAGILVPVKQHGADTLTVVR